MESTQFPTLLTSQATLLANLTRFDLAVLGCAYMILSRIELGGITTLAVSIGFCFSIKLIQKYLPRGYFRYLGLKKISLDWNYSLEKLHE